MRPLNRGHSHGGVLKLVKEGETAKLSKRAIRERELLELYARLLDHVGDRILQGSVHFHLHKPVELTALAQQKKVQPVIACFGTKNQWVIKGFKADVTKLDPNVILAELKKKRKPTVYCFKEHGIMRLIVVFHSKSGFALIAEQRPLDR